MNLTKTILYTLILTASFAHASIKIDTVVVGNAGNAADRTTFGAVSYEYHIGTYQVTNAQYAAFLNAVASTDTHSLYSTAMGSTLGGISRSGSEGTYTYFTLPGAADKPVNYVTFWSAARFANWLTNGQPTGDQDDSTTETGMYNLGGVTNPDNDSVTRQRDFSLGQGGVAVASRNEWYKAAYYDQTLNNGFGGYWNFPTRSNDEPAMIGPNSNNSNSANYGADDNIYTDGTTVVGSYTKASSFYGTFDQAGNVWEWTDAIVGDDSDRRLLLGGAFTTSGFENLSTTGGASQPPTNLSQVRGFRVTSLAPISKPSE